MSSRAASLDVSNDLNRNAVKACAFRDQGAAEGRLGASQRQLPLRSAAGGTNISRCVSRETPRPMARLLGCMSGFGIVSRVTPVHTAVRNCTRDEGRPFEVGNQVLISSHRKLLSSKAMVVNVAEKLERDFGRYD